MKAQRGQGRSGHLWCAAVVALACPAMASPLVLMPLSPEFHVPHVVARSLVVVLGVPRLWAIGATLLAVLGARRFATAWWQEALAIGAVIAAWWWGGTTAVRIAWWS